MQSRHARLVVIGMSAITLVTLVVASLLIMDNGQQPAASRVNKTGAVKISVSKDGFVQVKGSALRDAGLNISELDVNELRLSLQGQTVPYDLVADSLIFYGQASSDRYAPVRTYLLETGEPGQQMRIQPAVESNERQLYSVTRVIHLEQNQLYDSRAQAQDGDSESLPEPWFWATVQPSSQIPVAFSLPSVVPGSADLKLALWGLTHDDEVNPDHDFEIELNAKRLTTISWDGPVYHSGKTPVPNGILVAGENRLLIDNRDSNTLAIDIMLLDWVELTYQSLPIAEDDLLVFQSDRGKVTLSGFSDLPRVYDISHPEAPTILETLDNQNGAATLFIENGMSIAAVGPKAFTVPVDISPIRKNILKAPGNQADLIIITTGELAPQLAPLISVRQEQGLQVVTVLAEDIYDTFAFGQAGPQAISTFLRFAAEQWQEPHPRYLLIVGDATYDYKNYLGQNNSNFIPSLMVPVSFGGETISDNRLADIDGDAVPDMAVGRWPVTKPQEVASLVERTLAYEEGHVRNRMLFAADGTSNEFTTLSDRLIQDSGLRADRLEKLYGSPSDQLIHSWNEGAWLVYYVGHGSLDRWGKDDTLSSNTVEKLETAGSPPIVVQLTCLTGFFAHPSIQSLSESMLLDANGPVQVIAATSLTLSDSQRPFGLDLLRRLERQEVKRMGDAILLAKQALDIPNNRNMREISDTFGLLGDPSGLILYPE